MKNWIDFICIGAGRCGTTWLFDNLRRQPDFDMAKGKETNFFNYYYDAKDLSWYHSLFLLSKDMVSGEVSNTYYYDIESLKRIAQYRPDIKIIFCIRNPRDLLTSMMFFWKRRHTGSLKVQDFLKLRIDEVMGSVGVQHRDTENVTVRDAIDFNSVFTDLITIFDRSNIIIFDYDEFFKKPSKNFEELCCILSQNNIDRIVNINQVNKTSTSRFVLLGKLASFMATILRTFHLNSLLDKLKSSKFVWNVLNRETNTSDVDESQKEISEYFEANPELIMQYYDFKEHASSVVVAKI